MADKQPLATFLVAVHGVHISGSGTKETSFYTAIINLLDGIGDTLKPKVRCVMQFKNLGAGNPDGGLFTTDQIDRKTEAPKKPGCARARCGRGQGAERAGGLHGRYGPGCEVLGPLPASCSSPTYATGC